MCAQQVAKPHAYLFPKGPTGRTGDKWQRQKYCRLHDTGTLALACQGIVQNAGCLLPLTPPPPAFPSFLPITSPFKKFKCPSSSTDVVMQLFDA